MLSKCTILLFQLALFFFFLLSSFKIIMDNGPATKLHTSRKLQEVGDIYGDPFEVSTIRRDVSFSLPNDKFLY